MSRIPVAAVVGYVRLAGAPAALVVGVIRKMTRTKRIDPQRGGDASFASWRAEYVSNIRGPLRVDCSFAECFRNRSVLVESTPFRQRPLSRASRPFLRLFLNGRKGSNLPIRRAVRQRPVFARAVTSLSRPIRFRPVLGRTHCARSRLTIVLLCRISESETSFASSRP